jgi:hypothetical protein
MKGNLGGEVRLRVETLSEDNSATTDSLWASECMLGILNANRKNPQAHGYRCSFHPRVFQGIDFPKGTQSALVEV